MKIKTWIPRIISFECDSQEEEYDAFEHMNEHFPNRWFLLDERKRVAPNVVEMSPMPGDLNFLVVMETKSYE